MNLLVNRIIVLVSLVLLTTKPATAMEKAYIFDQTSSVLGKIEFIVGSTGIRVNLMRGTCSMVARKPSWNVVVYNTNEKLGYFVSRTNWIKDVPSCSSFKYKFKGASLRRSHEERLGLSTLRLTVPVSSSSGSMLGMFRASTSQSIPAKRATYIGVENLKFSKSHRDFIHAFYRSPAEADIPFEMFYTRPNGSIDHILRTNGWKIAKVPESTFDYVASFKRAKSVEDVLFGSQLEMIMGEMLDVPNSR